MPPTLHVHFVHTPDANAIVDPPLRCPHPIAYRDQLRISPAWEPDTSKYITNLVQGLNDYTPFSWQTGIGILDLEIVPIWRRQLTAAQRRSDASTVERLIHDRLDLTSLIAREVWDRDISLLTPDDSPFARYRSPMLYCSSRNGVTKLPDSSTYKYDPKRETLIPFVTNRNYNSFSSAGYFPVTGTETKAIARCLYELNSGLDWSPGLNRGVVCWSEDKTPEDQQTFFDWVSLLNKELLTLESTSQ